MAHDPHSPLDTDSPRVDERNDTSEQPASTRRPYSRPTVTTRRLYERLALSCEHAVDPDTGELIIDGPS